METENDNYEMNGVVRIEKRHKILKKMTYKKDPTRPVLSSICVDMDNGYLVASDAHIMGAMKADLRLNEGNGTVCLPDTCLEKDTIIEVSRNKDCTNFRGIGVNGVTSENLGTYPKWWSVIPIVSEDLHFILTEDGRCVLMNFLKDVKKKPNNCISNNKKTHKLDVYYKSYERVMHVLYDNSDDDIHMSCDVSLDGYKTNYMQFGISAEYLLMIDKVWNGSFWFKHPTEAIVFDSDNEDTFLVMPMMLEDEYVKCDNECVRFDIGWNDRYRNQGTNKNNVIMGYELEKLSDGTYEVRGSKKKKLTESVRKMAAYMMGKPDAQIKCQDYFNKKYGCGKDADEHYPLPEQELYDMLHGSLLEQGIEVATVELSDERKGKKKEPKYAPKEHLRIVEPETPPQPKQQEEEGSVKIERTTTMVGRRFYPLLLLTDGDTQVVVAGNSLYEAISDQTGDILDRYQDLFDSTDAFIEDDLLTSEELDETAICEAVGQFMDMVEQAS